MKVHLIDGTYELFRHYHAIPRKKNRKKEEIAAARGVVVSMLSLLNEATHIAVATDHVIESFRNQLWADYKDSSGVPADLLSQFGLLEDALQSLGIVVWAMIEYEADDALAAGASICAKDPQVDQVLICTPDKDLAQCVTGNRIVQFDRRRNKIINEEGVIEKFGIEPESIPDYLALVGDSADGFPGVPGWGSVSASTVLRKFKHLEQIPENVLDWKLNVNAGRLAATLRMNWEKALLFRVLATLVVKGPVKTTVNQLRWRGPEKSFETMCERLEAPELLQRALSLAASKK